MGNLTGDFSSQQSDSLSPLGLQQARAIVPFLKEHEMDFVYVSPLRRALQTIAPYGELRDSRLEIWPELAESCWQDERNPSGPEKAEYQSLKWPQWLDEKHFYFRDNRIMVPAENENYKQGISRLKEAVNLLKELHQGGNEKILLVSHGYSISRIMELFMGIPPEGHFNSDNTALSSIEVKNDRGRMLFFNRLLHAYY